MLISFLIWIIPILIVPASFPVFKIDLFRSFRYWVYAVILFMAFLLNLLSLSFREDVWDICLSMLVLFIFCEFFWYFSRVRSRIIHRVLLAVAVVLYSLAFGGWIVSGPQKMGTVWKNTVDGEFDTGKTTYTVKGRKELRKLSLVRVFDLERDIRFFPLEKKVRSWYVPEGYYLADFHFKWSKVRHGVRLDLISGKDILWTMGEEFNN